MSNNSTAKKYLPRYGNKKDPNEYPYPVSLRKAREIVRDVQKANPQGVWVEIREMNGERLGRKVPLFSECNHPGCEEDANLSNIWKDAGENSVWCDRHFCKEHKIGRDSPPDSSNDPCCSWINTQACRKCRKRYWACLCKILQGE